MRTVHIAGTGRYAAVIIAMFWSALAFGQQQAAETSQNQQAAGTGSLGVFAGFTDIDGGDTQPTIGGEYEYRLQGQWSVGGILEHTSDAYFASDATLAMGAVHYRPEGTPRLKLTGGAGVEFNDFGDDVRLRAGVGYDLIEGPVTLTPRLSLDFGNSRENLVLGATAYFRL